METWEEAQKWESSWWNTCQNTVWEDVKQMSLAPYMGLKIVPNAYTNYRIPLNGQSVLDIGGGPSSLLLKCENYGRAVVADPCDYPEWTVQRYLTADITPVKFKGEDLCEFYEAGEFDEVWIYNCLQHTEDPELIIRNAQKIGKIIRLFEWIETKIVPGHPHSFTEKQFNEWLCGEGHVYNLSDNGLYGKAYAGVFLGENYSEETKKEV